MGVLTKNDIEKRPTKNASSEKEPKSEVCCLFGERWATLALPFSERMDFRANSLRAAQF